MGLWSYNNKGTEDTVEKLIEVLILVEVRDELDFELEKSDKGVYD